MLEITFLGIFVFTLFIIGLFDFKIYIIPNKLVFPLIILGIVYQLLFGNIPGLLLGFSVSFLIGFVCFSLGGMGGGDVKLMAAIGAWLGFENFIVITLVASIFGLIWAVIDFIRQKRLKEKALHIYSQLKIFKLIGHNALDVKNKDLKKPIPFGGFLALAAITVVFVDIQAMLK
mgnify:CR=1 FL=1